MFFIKDTEHVEKVNKLIGELFDSEGDVRLITTDGKELLIGKILFKMFCPLFGDILYTHSNGSDIPVFSLPLTMRTLQLLLDLKLRGFATTTDEEELERVKEAINTLGLVIKADQLGIEGATESNDATIEMKEEQPDDGKDKMQPEVKAKGRRSTMNSDKRCDKCAFYSKRGALKAHILESHSGEAQIEKFVVKDECEIADEELGVNPKIEQKMCMTKDEVKGTKCRHCKEILKRGTLKKHVKEFHPEHEIFRCDECGYESLKEGELKRHAILIHRDSTKCSYCHKDVKFIEDHLEKFHTEQLEKYSCEKCPYIAYSEAKLDTHIYRKHSSKRGVCGQCNKRVNNLSSHLKKHKTNKFECVPCTKNFSVKRDLCRHILYEHEKRRTSCDICGKVSVTNLKNHMKFNHPDY